MVLISNLAIFLQFAVNSAYSIKCTEERCSMGGGIKRLRTEGGKVLSIPAGSEVWGVE